MRTFQSLLLPTLVLLALNAVSRPPENWKNQPPAQPASGVYLVHVHAPGYGERTLKWFGIGREFDPSGL